jgi:hypothetical protein
MLRPYGLEDVELSLPTSGLSHTRAATTLAATTMLAKNTAPIAHHEKKLENAEASRRPRPRPEMKTAATAVAGRADTQTPS